MMVIMLTLPILAMLTQTYKILLVAMMKALHGATQVYQNKESQAYISTNFTTKPNTPGRSEKTSKNYENFKWKIFLFSLGSLFGFEMRQHFWSFGSLPIRQGFTQITRSSWFANLNNGTMLTKQTCQNCFCWYWNNLLGVHRSWRCQLFRDIRAKGLFMLHLEDCCICSHNLLLSFSWKLSCWWLQKEDLTKALDTYDVGISRRGNRRALPKQHSTALYLEEPTISGKFITLSTYVCNCRCIIVRLIWINLTTPLQRRDRVRGTDLGTNNCTVSDRSLATLQCYIWPTVNRSCRTNHHTSSSY